MLQQFVLQMPARLATPVASSYRIWQLVKTSAHKGRKKKSRPDEEDRGSGNALSAIEEIVLDKHIKLEDLL